MKTKAQMRGLMIGAALTMLAGTGLPAGAQVAPDAGAGAGDPNFQLPRVFDNPRVPTDFTDTKVDFQEAENLLLRGEAKNMQKTRGIVRRDDRFHFEPHWTNLAPEARMAMMQPGAPVEITRTVVVKRELAAVIVDPKHKQFKELIEDTNSTKMPSSARIKANVGTSYTVTEGDLILNTGAVLVETNSEPLVLRTALNDKRFGIALKSGALCLVSNMDGRLIVANLLDRGRDACSIHVFGDGILTERRLDARAGQLWEFAAQPGETAPVTYDVMGHLPIAEDMVAELYPISYPRLLKRYNMLSAIDTYTMRNMLKTAAAVAHIGREERANNAFIQKQQRKNRVAMSASF